MANLFTLGGTGPNTTAPYSGNDNDYESPETKTPNFVFRSCLETDRRQLPPPTSVSSTAIVIQRSIP